MPTQNRAWNRPINRTAAAILFQGIATFEQPRNHTQSALGINAYRGPGQLDHAVGVMDDREFRGYDEQVDCKCWKNKEETG